MVRSFHVAADAVYLRLPPIFLRYPFARSAGDFAR